MRLAEKRGLMKLPFDPAPQIAVPAETLVEHYGYQHRRANYLAGARMEGDTLILTAYTHDGKPLYRTFQQPDDLLSQFPVSEKPSDATLSTIFGQYHGVYHMTAEDTNLIRAWCKNNARFPSRAVGRPVTKFCVTTKSGCGRSSSRAGTTGSRSASMRRCGRSRPCRPL